MAFASLEPFGSVVDDLRSGLGAAMTYNVNRGPDTRPISPFDLFPWHERSEERVETREELVARIQRELIEPANG